MTLLNVKDSVNELELSSTVGESIKSVQRLEHTWIVPKWLLLHIPSGSVAIAGYLHKRNKSLCSHKAVHLYVHRSFFTNRPQMKFPSTNEWINKL